MLPPWELIPNHGPKQPAGRQLTPPRESMDISPHSVGSKSRESELQALLEKEEAALLREANLLARACTRASRETRASQAEACVDSAFSSLLFEGDRHGALRRLDEARSLDPASAPPRHDLIIGLADALGS